jgi:outer membrane protein TolC
MTSQPTSSTRRSTTRLVFGAAFLAVSATACSAQMSLTAAVDLALKADPRVRMARASVAKAEAVVSEARDVYIPSVGIKGGYGASTGVPLSVPVVFSLASNSLIFDFSQKDNVRAANDGLKAAQLALLDAQAVTSEDTVVTYLNLNNAERRHAAMLDESLYANRLATIVQQRLDAGQDNRMDLLKAQRAAAQIRLATLNNEDEIANLTQHLSQLLGLPGTAIATVSESVPPLPDPSSIQLASDDSYGIQSAFAVAKSKQESAFGEARYRYHPQVAFGANYSRISTSHTSYSLYYPGFVNQHSDNALSAGIEITIPIFDYEHRAHARESQAEAIRAMAEAENNRVQFLEGRAKTQRSLAELSAKGEIAHLDRSIAQEQLDAILIQLNSSSSSEGSGPMMTPKDEQNARLQERQKTVDMLTSEQELQQAEIGLLRQNGQLGDWLKQALRAQDALPVTH